MFSTMVQQPPSRTNSKCMRSLMIAWDVSIKSSKTKRKTTTMPPNSGDSLAEVNDNCNSILILCHETTMCHEMDSDPDHRMSIGCHRTKSGSSHTRHKCTSFWGLGLMVFRHWRMGSPDNHSSNLPLPLPATTLSACLSALHRLGGLFFLECLFLRVTIGFFRFVGQQVWVAFQDVSG